MWNFTQILQDKEKSRRREDDSKDRRHRDKDGERHRDRDDEKRRRHRDKEEVDDDEKRRRHRDRNGDDTEKSTRRHRDDRVSDLKYWQKFDSIVLWTVLLKRLTVTELSSRRQFLLRFSLTLWNYFQALWFPNSVTSIALYNKQIS